MYITLISMAYWLLFFSCNANNNSNPNTTNIDTSFVSWNKVTFQSLTHQIEVTKDSTEQSLYENRILAFKAYIGINSVEDINVKSIRYQFIKELLKNTKDKRDFYIVEANKSGERVEIRNYVVYPLSSGKADIYIYTYVNRKWIKKSESIKLDLLSIDDLMSYRTKFNTGFNQDDIIVTRFANNIALASEFYLYSTLSDKSNLKEIVSLK